MSRRERKSEKSGWRRALRAVARILLAVMLFALVASWLPFARFPEPPDAQSVNASVESMLADIETPDRAAIIESSTDALDERIRLMAQAEREIIITTYECHDGESTRDVLAVALHMAGQGVKVRFLADGIAGRLDIMPNDLFAAAAGCENVEIRFYNLLYMLTPWRNMGRMHDKYVIVDDTAYLLGGRNMYDGFLGDYPTKRHYSHDREALIYNSGRAGEGQSRSSLFQLRDYFEDIWDDEYTRAYSPKSMSAGKRDAILGELEARYGRIREEKPELFRPMDYEGMTEPTDGVWLLSNPTTIYAKQPVLFAQLCALMDKARESVVIHSPYAVLNSMMRRELAEAAARVPVTLMVNAVENGANFVASSDYLYHREEVLSTGVRLLEYAGGKSYHGKAIAIDDDISIIGSFNLDMRSAYVDTELMLVIRGQAVNAQLRRNMEALHADCRRVLADGECVVPESLEIAPLPLWKSAAMRVLGAVLQLTRNII